MKSTYRRVIVACCCAGFALAVGFASARPVSADALTILNPSFEDPLLANGAYVSSVADWTTTPTAVGTFDPWSSPSPLYPDDVLAHGENVMYMNSGTATQTLTETVAANTLYILDAALGQRSDYPGTSQHQMQLWAGAQGIGTAAINVPTPGTFRTGRIEYFAAGDAATLDQPLEIRLIKNPGPQANFDDLHLEAWTAAELQNATALYSQGGFGVAEAIDSDLTSTSGWAGAAGPPEDPTPENIGAFETVDDVGYESGTVMTFRLDQQYSGHSIGKFRLSVTTDDRSTFADGAANGGDVEANWTPLTPLSAESANGATMALEHGGTVFVGGTRPSTDTYTVKAVTGLTGITGVRLELLEDPRLSDTNGGIGGPGRTGHGNYVLSDFRVVPERLLRNATATFSQGSGFGIDAAIDEDAGTGWAIGRGGEDSANEETGVFETAVDLGLGGAQTLLTFTLDQLYGSRYNIGKFRLSATTDDRALFADGELTGGDVEASWIELTPTDAWSANGTTLTINPDNSILASGTNPDTETYTVEVLTKLHGITGFRLELLEDTSLPFDGPGRGGNSNLVLTSFNVDAQVIIPEPASALLLGLGWLALVGLRRCRSRRSFTIC